MASRGGANTSDQLGALLVRRGAMSGEQLLSALHEEQRRGIPFTIYIAEMGFVSEMQIASCVAEHAGLPLLGSRVFEDIGTEAVGYLTKDLADRYRVMPISAKGSELHVGISDPQRLEPLDDLGRTIGRTLRPGVVTETALNDALERHYGIRPETRLFREGKAPPPSDHGMRRVQQEIDRTGVFRVPPSLVQPVPEGLNSVELLATADSANDVLRASVTYFGTIFPAVVALGIHKGRALALMVSDRSGFRSLQPPIELPLSDGSAVRSVLDRPQAVYRPTVTDPALQTLCRAVGMPITQVTSIPAFDSGRPAFVMVGQGLDEKQVKQYYPEIKAFLGKVSKAIRAVVLRAEIRA
jgi:hypothetical protein